MQIHQPHAPLSKESKQNQDRDEAPKNTFNKTDFNGLTNNSEILGKGNSDSIKNNKIEVNSAKINVEKKYSSEQIENLAKHEYSEESLKLIQLKLAEIIKANRFTIIENPDQILNRKSSINKILVSVSVSDTQKILYQIIPIRFAPLNGKLRILKQNISYHSIQREFESEMEKFQVESSIIRNIILDFTTSVKMMSDDLFISGNEVRNIAKALNDPITIDTQTPGSENKIIAYRYKGIPAIISITPILVFTGILDIDMGERMKIKKIESIGLYISKTDTLQWALDYILKKKKKAMESPASMAVRKDFERINGLKTMIGKSVIAAHLIFQLVAIPLSALGIINSIVYYLLFGVLSVGTLIGYFKVVASLEKKKPVIRSEKDLFKPEHKRYMDIHLKWMNKDEPVEFKTQLLEEYRLLTLYYESLSMNVGTSNLQSAKNKKSLLQYIDTRDVSKDRIMEQFQAINKKKNGSKNATLENTSGKSTEPNSHSFIATKNHQNSAMVMKSPMNNDSLSTGLSKPKSASEDDYKPASNSYTDNASNPISASEYESELQSNDSISNPISASEYDSEVASNPLSKSKSKGLFDSINEFEAKDAAKITKDLDIPNENQQGREKQISINIESGIISNLQGDLVDSIKEFLNL